MTFRWGMFWGAIVVGTILNLIVAGDAVVITQAGPIVAATATPAKTPTPCPTVKPAAGANSQHATGNSSGSPSPVPAPHYVRAIGENEDEADLPVFTRGELVWFRFAFIEVVLAAVGLALVFTSLRARLPFAWPGTALVYGSQIGLIFVGIIGGLVHASWVAPDASGRYVPNLDTTTILWFTLIVVGVYLPRLQRFGIAGAEIELVAEAGKGATTDIADLLVRWLDLSNQLESWLKSDPAPADTIRDFIRDRAEEASALMSSTGEYLRTSFWVYSEGGYLRFLQSEQITDEPTKAAKFRSGEGLLGITYRDGMSRNIAEPRLDAGWIEIDGTTRDYNGLLLEPITWENDKIGVLAIDHTAKAEFLPVAVSVAKALAKISARALGSPASVAALERVAQQAQGKA